MKLRTSCNIHKAILNHFEFKHFPSPYSHLGAEDGEPLAGHERQRGRSAAPAVLEQHDRLQRRLGLGRVVVSEQGVPNMLANLG